MRIQTIHTKNLRWLDVVNPGSEELAWLKSSFRFHELHHRAIAQKQIRPHIDQGDGYNFMVLLFPVYEHATQEIFSGEVDFFVGEKFLLTIHYGEINTLKFIFDEVKNIPVTRNSYMQKGPGFLLYKVLENLFRRNYPILDHMTKDIDLIENQIFHESNVDLLSRIMLMKKNIIEVRKMMKTHNYVLEKLPKRYTTYLKFPSSKMYYEGLLEYSQNIWDILEALKETADTLAETSQSLATHRLNEITKMISLFSAAVIPATLVAFLFAIRVPGVPFGDHPFGFWIVLSLMLISSISTMAFFKAKKWF